MDEIDLGLHDLSSELGMDKSGVIIGTTTNILKREGRYIYLLKRFFFYWMTAFIIFIFLLWASPDYFYDNVMTTKGTVDRKFQWTRFIKVFIFLYALILGTYFGSNYLNGYSIFL